MATTKRRSLLGRRSSSQPVSTAALAMANLDAQERQSRALDMAAQAAATGVRTRKQILKLGNATASLEELWTLAADKNSRVHVGTVDLAGQLGGVLSFEAINWLLRKLESIWPGFAENTDLWQSLPHLVIGMIVYWAELLSRKPDMRGLRVFPSMPREIAHEWAKAFTLLGANNLWRALRVRRRDTQSALAQVAALQAEVASLNKQLEDRQAGQGGRSNG